MADTNRLNFLIGGPAGAGVATVGLLFGKCMQRAGLNVFGTNDYPSLIKGGHNTYAISASDEPIHSLLGKPDMLIALDQLTAELHAKELSADGALIYDSNRVKGENIAEGRSDIFLVGAPFTEMASKAGGEIMFNTVALGASIGVLGMDFSIVEGLMRRIWGKKGEAVVQQNISAVRAGFDYSRSELKMPFKVKIEPVKREKTMFINGNEAVVVGAVRAGCKFVAEYPMSPSSSILHLMAGHERDYGIIVKQTEDELSAAHMIAGASFAGARSMTATSGGGFSLMTEALGMMGMMELPCVIINSQRCGPSTGLPTYTEQADLLFSLHASQGEFPRVVVAPGDQVECYVETINAFNIAELVQTPVIVLLDKYISESSKTIEDFRKIPVKIERGRLVPDSELKTGQNCGRYAFNPEGISPRMLPGQKNGLHVCSSYEHDETGFSSEDPKVRVAMINKRSKKLAAIPENMIAPSFHGSMQSKAEALIVCWGSTKGPAIDALKFLSKEGISARVMHLRYAEPFPSEKVLSALKSAKNILMVEGNSNAQMRLHIFQKTGFFIKDTYLRYDGRPFTPKDIADRVKEILKK